MKELLDQKITNIYLSKGARSIIFKNDEGIYTKYLAEGDCFSDSWINDLVNPECLFGSTILKVEHINIDDVMDRKASVQPSEEELSEHECLQVYAIKFTTSKGYFDLVFRNSSNGYYGGWMELDAKSSLNLSQYNEIKEDWSY